MSTAMFTAVTGLLANQERIDVIANNIANVNTTGYRSSRALFKDVFSETLQGGTAPSSATGGSNPEQIGLGVTLSSIDIDFTGGSPNTTGVSSDLCISGDGFFVLSDGTNKYYTRDGSFDTNTAGYLIDPSTGTYVQGYMADSTGKIATDTPISNLYIPVGSDAIVKATTSASFNGNLNSDEATGTTVERQVQSYDSLGTERDFDVTFTKANTVTVGGVDYNAWTWTATYDGTDVLSPSGSQHVVLFDDNGKYYAEGTLSGGTFTASSGPQISASATTLGATSLPIDPFTFTIDFSSVTTLSDTSDITLSSQDGFPRGILSSYDIGTDGTITGAYSNGMTRTIGAVALATFSNTEGLKRSGSNLFLETPSSGLAQVGYANSGSRGSIQGGALESSNVDLGTELSNMIVTQRAYQANARSVTTVDTMLQEAVNLIR